ncbi:hypothetical protein Plhal304r1_c062g0148931 [Plasmopara halstedii]
MEKQIVINLEKLKSLAISASLLDVMNPTDRMVPRHIQELQKSLKMMRTVQTTITLWLVSN